MVRPLAAATREQARAAVPGLQPKMREDLLDHRLLQDRCDDLQLAAAVRERSMSISKAKLRRRLTCTQVMS